MYLYSLILTLLSMVVSSENLSQKNKPFPHFYAYSNGAFKESKRVYGSYELGDEKIIKSHETADSTKWFQDVYHTIDQLDNSKSGLLLYIHGFQGDNISFVQESGFIIQEKIFAQPSHEYGMAVSLQWSSSFKYDESVENAKLKGENFAILVNDIYNKMKLKNPDSKITVMCHSMGNRVWQGLYEKWICINNDVHLENILMFAADLESNILETGFTDLEDHADYCYVFHSLDDRTLQMANVLKAHTRLGIVGPDHKDLLPKNIIIRDMTKIRDDETFAGKMSLHRYYYGSPTVRQEIVEILCKD